MISRVICGVICLLALTATTPLSAATKSNPTAVRIQSPILGDLRVGQSLATASACSTGSDTAYYWMINGWVYGNELYKGYVDPAHWCPGPYPFTVEEVNMPMYLKAGSIINVSVDVEAVDPTNPSCPVPGNLLSISSSYDLGPAPVSGIYNLWIPLDSPVTVDGPFFVGFFIGNIINPSVDTVALITDNFPEACNSYNIWDTTIGFVDLDNNDIFDFPGKLMLYCSGTTGGFGGTAPAPAGALLSPKKSDYLMGSTDFWFNETSNSKILSYAAFEWRIGTGAWTEISRDYDGASPLRDGVTAATAGEGWSYSWNLAGVTEGLRQIKATVIDTLGRKAADSFNVFFEPTPPLNGITSPANGADFCPQTNYIFSTSDENMQFIELYKKDAQTTFALGLPTMNQATVGDANGNINDGNHAAGNEYGDYYCGPVAAAIAIKYLADHGVPNIMDSSGVTLTISKVAEKLAASFKTRANKGTYDNRFFGGLKEYLFNTGDEATLGFDRNPSYFDIRIWVEEEGRIAMLGLGGNPGLWVTVNGFSGWQNVDSTYTISISNPLTGTIQSTTIRNTVSGSELLVSGVWHTVDIMVSLLAKTWVPTRTLIGADASSANGWSINWTPANVTEGNLYFFRARGVDLTNYSKTATIMIQYDCSNFFTKGDYTGDGYANIVDLAYLISYFGNKGPAPSGGIYRADANCDNYVNIADMIYYMNYLFGKVAAPCH
ncbi:MAG: hypothetical protein HY851_06640 [candidate division Zixibacteria bacterium]|nr:hypothetical protein [candidate division Zixibacteria bacterium]